MLEAYFEALRQHAGNYPDECRLSYQTRSGIVRWSYLDLLQEIDRAALCLGASLHQRQVVLIENQPPLQFISKFLGAVVAGHVPMALHTVHKKRPEEVAESVGAGAIIDKQDEIRQLSDMIPPPDDVLFLQSTSGTTSCGRAVAVSEKALLTNLRTIRDSLTFRPEDTFCSWLPHYHDMGLIGGLLCPLFVGGSLHLSSPREFIVDPMQWLESVSRLRQAVIIMPVFGFRVCQRRHNPLADINLSSVRLAVTGAEPLHTLAIKKFVETFAEFGFSASSLRPCYGLAEATLMVSANHGVEEDDLNSAAPTLSSGSPVDQVSIVVKSDTADSATGEIFVSSPSLALGYYLRGEINAEDFSFTFQESPGKRFFRTGDIGSLIDDELLVAGRINDQLSVNGVQVALGNIEQSVLDASPIVDQCCVLVEAPENYAVTAIVEVRRGHDLPLTGMDELKQMMKGRFGIQADLRAVSRGWIPKTSSGKIRRQACRTKWASCNDR
jgi:acyl-CoA synthetase (AMP-forming)/AMP-acid ligase II